MMNNFVFAILVAFFTAAFAVPSEDHSNLPKCSAATYNIPCVCPHETTFRNLTTFAVIGAPAIQLQGVMDDFFESEWQGGPDPYTTTGDDEQVGATRTYNFTVPGGYYLFTETLTAQKIKPDGSFVFGFGQSDEPAVVKVPGGAEFHGEWSIIKAQQTVVGNETAISWNNWRCEVGTPYDAPVGHEGSLLNVSSILHQKGVFTGVDVKPFSIVYTERND